MKVFRLLSLALPMAFACSGNDKTSSGLDCGDGTHEEDGSCVPDEATDTDADADADDTGDTYTWVYEGEGDELAHDCGTTSDSAWKACDSDCEGGNDHLIYGPYASMPAGTYEVTWRLKTDDADRSSLTIIQLDVTTHSGSNYLAQHSLNRSEFSGAGIWQDFTLPFVHDGTSTLEYRVQYVDTHQPCVWVDWIRVVRL